MTICIFPFFQVWVFHSVNCILIIHRSHLCYTSSLRLYVYPFLCIIIIIWSHWNGLFLIIWRSFYWFNRIQVHYTIWKLPGHEKSQSQILNLHFDFCLTWHKSSPFLQYYLLRVNSHWHYCTLSVAAWQTSFPNLKKLFTLLRNYRRLGSNRFSWSSYNLGCLNLL